MPAAKAKRMTVPQLRKELKKHKTEELTALLEGVYKSCPDAADYINLRFAGDPFKTAFHTEMKERLYTCFYTKRGKARLDLPEAKSILEQYERICPEPGSILDLKLRYVEYGMEVIENYTRIPDSLYRGVEQMFRSIAKDINCIENADTARTLREQYGDRLAKAGKESGYGDHGFHQCMHETYKGITWQDERDRKTFDAADTAGNGQTIHESVSNECFINEPLPITYSGNILSTEDSDLFFELFYPLINYTNEKLHVNNLTDIKRDAVSDTRALKEITDALWKNPSLIDDYLRERGSSLSSEHQAIIQGFKRAVSGSFILERNLKNGGVLISLDYNNVYLVRGLTTSFEELSIYHPLPMMLSATLLPFRGIVISDGLFSLSNVFLGGGIKKGLKDAYNLAKRRNQIITAL